MTSSSGLGVAAGSGVGTGVGRGVELADGPLMEFGVGVGVGFVRPDCAKELPANNTKHTKHKNIERSGTS
jgi:hypothetical protein